MSKLSAKSSRGKKKNFSSYSYVEAFKQLNLNDLTPWELDTDSIQPSDFFQERLRRLEASFDLEGYEESKKLLIDAICEEALLKTKQLKLWKGAQLEGEVAFGYVDYILAEHKRYLDIPLLCIIEAKKDDFEKGLAQCLVEMQSCQWQNRQAQRSIEVYGIVTNGRAWRFYKLLTSGEVYETPVYSTGDMELLLGRLQSIFQLCEQNLQLFV
ncbi:MAG: hypothetical protein AAGF24_05805 [Cyanobacteria bacterium P01_H01_bin.121]